MSRRGAILAALAVFGGAAASAATVASATPTLPPIRGCPPGPILYESNGHDYVSVPDPTGQQCRMTIELPVTLPPT